MHSNMKPPQQSRMPPAKPSGGSANYSAYPDAYPDEGAGALGGAGDQPPEYSAPVELIPCNSCGRKFNEKAMEKHEKICQKVFVQKRKVFDVK